MNPLLIPLIIAIVVALAFLIAWLIAITETNKARRDVATLNRALGQERTNTASWRAEAGTWRKKFEALNKPRPSIGRPQESAPTVLQTKLGSMVNAVTTRRSPIRHAPNIQPRRNNDPSTDSITNDSFIVPGIVTGMLINDSIVPDHTDFEKAEVEGSWSQPDPSPSYSAPDPSPSYSAPDPSPSPNDSGSFSSGDSGSF